jgi:hypothetical protein
MDPIKVRKQKFQEEFLIRNYKETDELAIKLLDDTSKFQKFDCCGLIKIGRKFTHNSETKLK